MHTPKTILVSREPFDMFTGSVQHVQSQLDRLAKQFPPACTLKFAREDGQLYLEVTRPETPHELEDRILEERAARRQAIEQDRQAAVHTWQLAERIKQRERVRG